MIKKVLSGMLGLCMLVSCISPLTAYAGNSKVEFVTEAEASEKDEKQVEKFTPEETQPTAEEMQKLPSGKQGERDMNRVPLTEVDKNGNVKEVKHEEGYVEEPGFAMFSVSEQVVNFNVKSAGKTTNYTEVGTGTKGYTYGPCGADAAYLGMENGKVKFMLSGVIGLVNEDEVQVVSKSNVQSLSHYYVKNGILYHKIARNLNEANTGSTLNNGPAPAYLKAGVEYYSYDGHYFYTEDTYSAMLKDYNAGNRKHSVNPNQPFYNYFQYLPLRSTTTYSEESLNALLNKKATGTSKMKDTGAMFIQAQNLYGVNALLMASLAANESGWGKSNISQKKNNLFGLNAVDSSPGESANYFASVEQCIHEFAGTWMSKGYLNPKNWKYNVGFFGNKASGANVKYASDPYWGEKAASIAYALDSVNGNKDARRYTIAIRNTIKPENFTVNVRNKNATSGAKLYTSPKAANTAYLLLSSEKTNGFYQIQSDGVLNSQRTAVDSTTGVYNFQQMYAYMSADYLTIVNQGKAVPGNGVVVAPQPEPEKPQPEPEKPQPEPEKPQPEPEKPQPEPEKPQPEPEKPQPEPEKPQPEPEKPQVVKNGWVEEGGAKFYYSNGKKTVGEKKINKKWYCFDSEGKMIVGWHQLPKKKVYYNSNGQLSYGEKKIKGKWYYFDKVTGAMKTGFYKVPKKKKTVYYNSNGQMCHGEKKIKGKWYYFDKVTGAMKTGFQKIPKKNKTVYYNASGQMVYGERKINRKWYCFRKVTGAMIRNAKYKGHYYGSNGVRRY